MYAGRMTPTIEPLAEQAGLALVYYAALLLLMRLSGKRMAGQITMFDLIVLISLAVVVQNATLRKGTASAVTFVVTVFAAHRGMAFACARSPLLRRLVRGSARTLVRNGQVDRDALVAEGMCDADLLAGLRKLGIDRVEDVKVAALEETGHISAVRADAGSGAA
jgi:uncharacterized membrane protein YcaP (DUF421 family)